MPEKGFKADIIIPVYKPGELFIKQIGILKENAADIERIIIINTEESLMEKSVLDATDKADRAEDSPLFGKIAMTEKPSTASNVQRMPLRSVFGSACSSACTVAAAISSSGIKNHLA